MLIVFFLSHNNWHLSILWKYIKICWCYFQEGRTGNTPLLISLMNKNWDMANYLLERNAQVNIPSYSNFFPLHFAVQGNHVELVKKLLTRGAEMGSRSNEYDPMNNSADEVCQTIQWWFLLDQGCQGKIRDFIWEKKLETLFNTTKRRAAERWYIVNWTLYVLHRNPAKSRYLISYPSKAYNPCHVFLYGVLLYEKYNTLFLYILIVNITIQQLKSVILLKVTLIYGDWKTTVKTYGFFLQ